MIAALGPLYAAGHQTQDPLAYIDVLSDPARIVERGYTLAQAAQSSICVFFTYPSLMGFEEGLQLVAEPLSRGISYRSLYEQSAWEDPDLRDFISQCQTLGQDIRFVPELPFKMQLFDQKTSLLSLQDPLAGTPSFTALSITHPGLAQVLGLAFEQYWQAGNIFEVPGD